MKGFNIIKGLIFLLAGIPLLWLSQALPSQASPVACRIAIEGRESYISSLTEKARTGRDKASSLIRAGYETEKISPLHTELKTYTELLENGTSLREAEIIKISENVDKLTTELLDLHVESLAQKAETVQTEALELSRTDYQKAEEAMSIYEKLETYKEELLERGIEKTEKELTTISKNIDTLRTELSELKRTEISKLETNKEEGITSTQKNSPEINWQNLVEDPRSMEADTHYSVIFHNSNTPANKVVFYDKIVEDFFTNSKGGYQIGSLQTILSTIQKGYVNGDNPNGTGLKNLKGANKGVFEVRTVGSTGHIRIGGFRGEDTIYLTDYVKSGNHNDREFKNFVGRLNKAQEEYQLQSQ